MSFVDSHTNTPYLIRPEVHYDTIYHTLAYIDDHLCDDLSLFTLAQKSHYSPFHFHRIFHAITGHTPREYVLQRRLYQAAAQLVFGNHRITQIALDSGFTSSAAFNRNFTHLFHCSPSTFRRYPDRYMHRPIASRIPVRQLNGSMERGISCVRLPDLDVIGYPAQGLSETFESPQVEKAFRKLIQWIRREDISMASRHIMGITMESPSVTGLDHCTYFACIPSNGIHHRHGTPVSRTVPTKGLYLQFTLLRSKDDFTSRFFQWTDYLYTVYMPQNHFHPDNRPFIEYYASQDEQVEMTFHIPVQRLKPS